MKTLPMFLNGAWVDAEAGGAREIFNPEHRTVGVLRPLAY